VNAGNALVRLGRPAEAEPLLHEALNDARANGRKALAGNILNIMSEARALCGDFAGARAASDRALTEYRTLGKEHSLLVTLTTRADLEFRAGDAEAAVRIAQEALGGLDALTFGKALESALHANLSAYLVSLARYDEARIHARQALDVAQRLDAVLHEAWALQHLAAIAVLAPQMSPKPTDVLSRAARLIGFVDARYVALGSALEPTDRQEYDRILAALRAALPDDILASLLRGGAGMSEVEAIGEALKV
jgi:tetratricopeptide (TPR) repeat protein